MAVDEKATEALDLDQLTFPEGIPIESLEVEEYVDTSGEDALRVWLILPENFDPLTFKGEDVLALKGAIHDRLLERGIELFPYIHMVKPSELKQIRERS